MNVSDLTTSEYNAYYSTYITKIPNNTNLIEGFRSGQTQVTDFFKAIPNTKLEYAYAVGKWTIKEVYQHIIDTERVFMYRCFRIGRHDKTPLAGYNQDDYILPSNTNNKTLEDLQEEYQSVRQSSIVLLKSLSATNLKQTGMADNNTMSARAAAFIILGHEIHHINIIIDRYLNT